MRVKVQREIAATDAAPTSFRPRSMREEIGDACCSVMFRGGSIFGLQHQLLYLWAKILT
jgi:hypothetical protein